MVWHVMKVNNDIEREVKRVLWRLSSAFTMSCIPKLVQGLKKGILGSTGRMRLSGGRVQDSVRTAFGASRLRPSGGGRLSGPWEDACNL